jgi:hypothetical protein
MGDKALGMDIATRALQAIYRPDDAASLRRWWRKFVAKKKGRCGSVIA